MIIGGIIAIVIPFLFASFLIYIQLSNVIIKTTQEKSLLIAKNITEILDTTLLQELKLASAIAANPIIIEALETDKYKKADNLLKETYKKIGKSSFTIFLTDKNGISKADAFFDTEIGIDLSEREYFIKAGKGQPSIYGPVLSKSNETPVTLIIVAASPVFNSDEFLGMIGIPFNINHFSNIVTNKRIGNTGYAFLINLEGVIIAHPDKKYNFYSDSIENSGTKEIWNLVQEKKSGTVKYTFEGIKKVAGLSIMESLEMAVIFTQNTNEIIKPLNNIIISITIIAILFLLFSITIIVFYYIKIGTPVEKMFEMMKQITEHSKEIVIHISLDRKITYANKAFEKTTGIKVSNILGKVIELNPLYSVTTEKIWDQLESGNFWSGHIISGKSNSITLDVIIIPMKDTKHQIYGYLEIGHDISNEIMFEKRLQMSQKLEAVGTLAGGIAHDFNNILGGIMGYAELTLMDINITETIKQYVNEIIKGSKRARDLINQIMAFSRNHDIEIKPIQPRKIIKEALKLLRATIPSNINIDSNLNSNSSILANPVYIHQIIMNMFTNSLHAIGNKSGRISIELQDFFVDEIFLKTHPEINIGNHILIKLSDTGKGIGADIVEHIFDPFFTTKPVGEGTGLGLSVVHGIVKELKGIITVYSELGKGSTFNIVIPTVVDADVQKDINSNYEIKKGTGKILVIDDEEAIAETTKSILENIGYSVSSYINSSEAIETILLDKPNFDLIIVDYAMPKMTGIQFAKLLKENGINTPVIMISGFLDSDMEKAALDVGILKILMKPVTTHQLSLLVHNIIQSTSFSDSNV